MNWSTTATIGSLIQSGALAMSDGYRTKRSELGEEGFRIVRAADIVDGTVRLEASDFVRREFANMIGVKSARAGDVVLTTKGTVGRVATVPELSEQVVYSPQLCFFRVKTNDMLDARFLRFWFDSAEFRHQASHRMNNSDMAPYINLADIRSLRLTLPPLVEQRAIAGVLGALDDKIAANARLRTIADEYLASQFLMVLRTADTRTVRLSEIAAVNAEVVRPGPGQLRYIDISAVHVGSYEYPEPSDWNQAPSRARRGVSFGDTLWSTVRPNRRSHALNLHDDTNLVASTGLAVLSPIKTGFAYLYEVTKRPEFSAYLETVAEGSAYPAVREDRFKDAPVPLMAAQEVRRFEAVAGRLRRLAHATSVESRTLAALRDALLPHLISGKLRVQDAEEQIEPLREATGS